MYVMNCDHFCTSLLFQSFLDKPKRFSFQFCVLLLFYKPLCPVSTAYMNTGVSLAIEAWEISQWPYPKEKFSFPYQPSIVYSSSSRDGASWAPTYLY